MSRLTTTQIIEQGYYLDALFEPSTLTVAHLIGIFTFHDIKYPTPPTKARLVELFNQEIKGKRKKWLRLRSIGEGSIASEEGIVDGVSGLPIAAPSTSTREQKPVRRSTRRSTVEPPTPNAYLSPPAATTKPRRTTAEPVGREYTVPIKGHPTEPIILEDSESDEERAAEARKQKKSEDRQKRRVSRKFGPGTPESGWVDDNIFQSGGESSSPIRSPSGPQRPKAKPRTSLSAPPEVNSELEPVHSSPIRQTRSKARESALFQAMQRSPTPQAVSRAATPEVQVKPEPKSPPRSSLRRSLSPWVGSQSSPPNDENDDPIDMIEGHSGYADISTNDLSRDLDEDSDVDAVEGNNDGDMEDEAFITDPQTAEVSRRIANGGSQALLRKKSSTNSSPSISLWQRITIGIIAIALSAVVGYSKVQSGRIGYCETGSNTNVALIAMEEERKKVEICHSEQNGAADQSDCPPLPLVPFLQPASCTPCPSHANCTQFHVFCDDGFLLRPHLLSYIPLLSQAIDGIPGFGPIAFPPSCIEDPRRKRHIGVLGKAIDKFLAMERGKKLCAGIDQHRPIDGGDARRWGVSAEDLRQTMRQEASVRWKGKIDNFDSLFVEAVEQLLQYGRLLQEYDLSGNQYLATEHIEMSWNCRLVVTGREAWLAWRKAIFGAVLVILGGLYTQARIAVRIAENQRVAELVQIALDLLRNEELAHHVDPITTPNPSLSSLQLCDRVLQEEHSIPARRRLWSKVERVVEGNANVRVNHEELAGGDEAKVWRWIGGSGAIGSSGALGTPMRK